MPAIGVLSGSGDELLTANDLADMLGITRDALYDRRRRGSGLPPAIRIGRHLRWKRSVVSSWLDQQTEAQS